MSTTANITVYKNGVTLAPVVHRVRLVTGGAAAHNASASAHAGLFDPAGSALTAQAAAIAAAAALVDDLSGVNDAATARSNLGLGSAAVEDASAFDPAGAATSAQAAAESYTDGQIAALNLGTAAQADAGDFDAAGSAATAEAAAKSYADGLAANYDAAGSAAAVASDLADHEADTANPHSVTAAQVGADPAGSAATAQAAAIAAAQALVDDLSGISDASAARSNLGLGSAAVEDTSAFDPAGSATSAETAAKAYADGLATNYDPAGSAATAQAAAVAAAQAYTDSEIGGLGTMATEAAADYAALSGATFSGDVAVSGEFSAGDGAITASDITHDVSIPTGDLSVAGDLAVDGVEMGREIVFDSGGSDNTTKVGIMSVKSYSLATQNVTFFYASAALGNNTINIGGAAGGKTAATLLRFFTAANRTTLTGTERMRINNAGQIVVGGTSAISGADFSVHGDIAASGGAEIGGIIDYTGAMGDSTKDPTADAPADWLEIQIGGATYYIPAYAA